MKKFICLFTLVLFITNCKAQEVIYLNDLPNESDLAIIEIQLGGDRNLITFVDDFENDNITIFDAETLIFEGKIITDPALGASRGFDFSGKTEYLKVKINNSKEFKIENLNDYRFIYVYKKENKYLIKYSKKPIKFS